MYFDPGSKLLRNIAFLRTYAETLPNGKKETVRQTYDRVMNMHISKFPHLKNEITDIFSGVREELAMPSMRSMQFAGQPILRSNCRIYNCGYTTIESFKDIADIAWISMNGAGVGYSVQRRHISRLPLITTKDGDKDYVIPDSKEGWADSIILLLNNPAQKFIYTKIRAKDSPLSTGGTASGPESLMLMHDKMRGILYSATGRQLRPIEVHDILCHIGDLIRCGGVRRTALLALFDVDDLEMLTAKHGKWWETNPQRGRANNSAIIHRADLNVIHKINQVLDACFDSNSGEPGIYLTNNLDWGCNPCCEIAMCPRSFCNLTEINASACKTKDDFLRATETAVAIGTLQATYTDFSYIDDRWAINSKKEALLGVSITGQAEAQHLLTNEILQEASRLALKVNTDWAIKLGIASAARIGCTKPSGSTSAFLGTTSGIHAAHDDFFLRRVRVEKSNPIAKYLSDIFGINQANSDAIFEQDEQNEDLLVITIPICKKGALKRTDENAITLLERVKNIHQNWIVPTHRSGDNMHNVSVTVSYKYGEEDSIRKWMIYNRYVYSGISLLPFSGGSYNQMPFQSITKAEYESWTEKYPKDLNFENINFAGSKDTRKSEGACNGNSCELV